MMTIMGATITPMLVESLEPAGTGAAIVVVIVVVVVVVVAKKTF